jgi:hypothetical protein
MEPGIRNLSRELRCSLRFPADLGSIGPSQGSSFVSLADSRIQFAPLRLIAKPAQIAIQCGIFRGWVRRRRLSRLSPSPSANRKMADNNAVGSGCFVADALNEGLDIDLCRRRDAELFHLRK